MPPKAGGGSGKERAPERALRAIDAGVESCIETLKAYPGAQLVAVRGFRVLATSAQTASQREEIAEQDGFPIIVEVMKRHSGSQAAFSNGCRVVMNLSQADHIARSLVEEGALEVLLQGMAKHKENLDVCSECVRTIENLLADDEGRETFTAQNGIQAFVSLLKENTKSAVLCVCIAKALATLAVDRAVFEPLCKTGALLTLLQVMDQHTGDAAVFNVCVNVFLVISSSTESNTVLLEMSGPRIMGMCKKLKESAHAIAPLFNLIAAIAVQDDCVDILLEDGIVDLVVDTLTYQVESNDLDDEAVKACLSCLTNVSVTPDAQSHFVTELDGVVLVCQAMQNSESEEVANLGLRALINITTFNMYSGQICRECISPVLTCMERFHDEETLIYNALRVVARLARLDENIGSLMTSGMVGEVQKVIREHQTNPQIAHLALKILCFCTRNARFRDVLVETRTAPDTLADMQLVFRLHVKVPEVVKYGSMCFLNLASDNVLRRALFQGDAMIVALTPSLRAHVGRIEVVKVLVRILSFVVQTATGTFNLQRTNLVQALVSTMEWNLFDAEVQFYGCSIFGQLALVRPNIPFIVNEGGLGILVSAMEAHTADLKLSLLCIGALHQLATHEMSRPMLVQNGGATAVFTILQKNETVPDIAGQACTTLAQLLAFPKVVDALLENKWIEIILNIPKHCSDDAYAAASWCKLVATVVTLPNEACRTPFVEKEGLKSLVLITEKHPKDLNVMRSACIAIHQLLTSSKDQTEMVRAISQFDVFTGLIRAMENHPGDPDVAYVGVGTLEALLHRAARNNTVDFEHLMRIIAGVLASHTKHVDTAMRGCQTLMSIAKKASTSKSDVQLDLATAISAVVSVMTFHLEHPEAVIIAATTLENIASLISKDTDMMDELDAIAVLRRAAIMHRSHTGALAAVFRALVVPTQSERSRATFSSEGGTDALTEALTMHSMHSDLCKYGCWVLAHLAMDAEFCVRFSRRGGIMCLNDVFTKQNTVEPVMACAIRAVANLAFVHECKGLLVQLVFQHLNVSMRNHHSTDITTAGSLALHLLADTDSEEQTAIITNAGAIPTIVSSSRSMPGSVVVACHGLHTIVSLLKHSANVETIVNQGGLQAILGSVKSHGHNPELMQMVCVALGLLLQTTGYTEMTSKAGAVTIVISALRDHYKTSQVVSSAIQTLLASCTTVDGRRSIVALGGINAVVTALQGCVTDATTSALACWLLMLLGSEEASEKRVLADGGAAAMAEVMRLHGDEPAVARKACQALCNIAVRGENVKRLLDDGVFDVLMTNLSAMAGETEPDVVMFVCKALLNIGPHASVEQRNQCRGIAQDLLLQVGSDLDTVGALRLLISACRV